MILDPCGGPYVPLLRDDSVAADSFSGQLELNEHNSHRHI